MWEGRIGATLQALVASIGTMNQAIVKLQEDIQEVKNDQKETKATMVAVLPELQPEKAAVIIQAFLRTTAVRVKLDRAKHLWGTLQGHTTCTYLLGIYPILARSMVEGLSGTAGGEGSSTSSGESTQAGES